MGAIRISHLGWRLPGGTELFDDVSFTVGDGERAAIVGANGVGKTTLLDLVAGDRTATTGTISVDGRLGVMRQLAFRRHTGDAWTVRDLLVSLAEPPLQRAATRLREAEGRIDDDPMGYAHAIAEWGDAGGYEAELHWDECCTRAVGLPFTEIAERHVGTFSGGEQKRLALEVLLRGKADVLLLDEPDNFLDVDAKRWLEGELTATRKTVLYVSHDRELLAATATKIVTIEAHGAWTHGGGFATYAEARRAHLDKLAHDRTLYDNERQRLEELVAEMRRRAKISEIFAPKLKAAESRLRLFVEKNDRPVDVREQRISMRLGGARTGRRALVVEQLELGPAKPGSTRLTDPFDLDVDFGDRVAVLGGNGAGKSHFLRLLGGDESVEHHGRFRLGAGVVPGLFHQTHEHPEWTGRTLVEILHRHDVVLGPAMSMLRRYEIHPCADQPFETLSGGQQARFQILLLETTGATMLLLDEPTDNLDLVSAEALEAGLAEFTGTVVAVTHDRWFLRGFDRFVVFGADGSVRDHLSVPAGWATA